MIKAVIFDMFETLVTLFEGRTYFGEHIAADVGADPVLFRKEWHAIEDARSTGKYTIEEGLEIVLKKLGLYSEENVRLASSKRRESLDDTFSNIPDDTVRLLEELKKRNIKIGLITNTFSDERDYIRRSILFPYFDVALISYEQGIIKPDPEMFKRMICALGLSADECLYVGDGGSKELFAARDAGMHPLQCTWFYDRGYEPHIPCPILDEFDHAGHQLEVLNFIIS
ncbi:MAG: HAD-IA family hydrolase [Lachnospiraceae bacterium]|nr:HAD-IA family hydrolase [Lachnospiraceae bacterium]